MTAILGPSPDDFHDRRSGEPRRASDQKAKFNWQAFGVLVAIGIAMLSWFGAGWNDYRRTNDRVLTLENQRVEDRGRMERMEATQERMEAKLDRLLERSK